MVYTPRNAFHSAEFFLKFVSGLVMTKINWTNDKEQYLQKSQKIHLCLKFYIMRKIIVTLLFVTAFSAMKACDICGCGTGNFNPYMFPHLSKNFFSLNYQYRYYRTHFFENNEEMNNREYYNSFLLAAQYSLTKKLHLMVVLPYQFNHQNGNEGAKSLNGVGDVVLMANYNLLDQTSKRMVRQTLQAGVGVKLATGNYHFDEANTAQVGNSNFQAGTGSTDYMLNVLYALRFKNFAFTNGFTYKINTENKNGYRFGNRFLNVTQLKYVKDFGSFSIIPSIGVMTEQMQEDKQDNVKIEDNHTGGYNVQTLLGLDINTKKWALGVNYSISIKQNLANGEIHSMPGLNVHLSYSF